MTRTRVPVEFRRSPVPSRSRQVAFHILLIVTYLSTGQAGWCSPETLVLLTLGQADKESSKPAGDSPAKGDSAKNDTPAKKDAATDDQRKSEKKGDAAGGKAEDPVAADQKEPEDGDAPAHKPATIQQLLKGLFGGGGGQGGVRGGRVDNPEGRNSERDFIDSRAPHDLKVEQVMRSAEIAIRKKDWKDGQELLQRLLDLPEDSLHRMPDGRWQSVRQTANRLLSSAPPEVLQAYETQYSGLAQQLLNEAKRSGRTSDYVNVASRFLHTPAGYEAANHLGTLHFDRGEFGLAAAWFSEIAASNSSFTANQAWRMKAALAYRQAGDVEAGKALLSGLTIPAGKPVHLASKDVNPKEWIESFSSAFPSRTKVLTDWTQIYGTVARIGTSTGGEPLLSPLWSVPMTTSHLVKRRLNWIIQDLLDQDRTPILAAMPLVVAGRAIYRDLRGVRAVDIETGKTIWESIEGISAERIIGGVPPQQSEPFENRRFRLNQFQFDQNEHQGQSVEYHPLASLLFRDGIYGLISSDGRQVFVIEDLGILSRTQPNQGWGWDAGGNEPSDPYGVSWKTNRLVSYDLATGRPRWSVGGIDSQESFDLPLAGSFFYGTPAIDGDELLVVAGKGDDIRLWSLDRATGAPRWSQLIAYSDTKIEQDLGRRWYTAQVAADGGIIVCPTTVGWLVAVDRLRQTVLWAHRYLPPTGSQGTDRDQGSQYAPQRELNQQWSPSAPVIAGNVVVYTPPEEPIVLALNMLNGRRLWEKPKESWLYLAGIFGDRVVLVGNTEVEAIHATTGKRIWVASLDDSHPSGRGLAVDDQYYLPLNNGELRVLDLKMGKTVSRSYVSVSQPPLGNMAMHQGKLVALGPQGMVGFGQRQAVIAEIQRRKTTDPQDPWALFHEAEIHLLNRDHAAALPLLQSVRVEGLSDEEKPRYRSELVQSLASVYRSDPKAHRQELDELGRIAVTDDEKRLFQELTADDLLAGSRFPEAFDVLWSLRRTSDPSALIARADDPHVSMVYSVWLSGRLQNLWDAASEAEREQVNFRITTIVSEAMSLDAPDRRMVSRLIKFHPESVRLRNTLVEEGAKAGKFATAQLELLSVASSPDRPAAARATERMARLMEQFQLPADAAHYYGVLEHEYGDVPWQEGQTCADYVKHLKSAGKIQSKQSISGATWEDRPLQLVQGPMQHVPPSQEVVLNTPLPFFGPVNVEIQQQEQRLALENISDNSFEWLAPLRSSPRNLGDGFTAAEFLGHEAVLIHRDVLHLMSPVEKRVLWSKSLDGSGEGGPFWRHASRPPTLSMTQASRESENQMSLLQCANFTGRLAVVQPKYLCVYGRRFISVLDPQTGDLLWRKEAIPQYAQVVGNLDTVFVIPQDRSKSEAYRASDGKPVSIEGLGNLLGNSLMTRGDSLVLLEQGLRYLKVKANTVVRMVNPHTKLERWRIEYPPGTQVSVLDQNSIFVLPSDGKVERIEVATGTRVPLAPLSKDDMKSRRNELFALMDDTQIYLVVNVQDTTGFHHYGESLPSIRVNGVIHAWNRSDGSRAWRQEVKQQNLVVDHFRALPVLVFVSRSWQQKGTMSYGTLSVKAIHKRTGSVLHNSTTPTMYSGFHSLDVNLSEPSIELKSYNLRMRLVPANEAVANPNPVAEPAKPKG